MKTLNVLINPKLNQFRILPPVIALGKCNINIHFGELDPSCLTYGVFNHDLYVTYNEGPMQDVFCPVSKTLYIGWHSKVQQTMFINSAPGSKLFTTSFSAKSPLYYYHHQFTNGIVIKPADSSRSMNVMIFKDRNFGLRQFTQDLCQILRKRKEKETENYTMFLQPEVKALVEAYGGEYILGSPRGNDNENSLWEGSEFIIQEYNHRTDVPNREYLELRVLSDGLSTKYFSRDHRECVGVVSKNVFTSPFVFSDTSIEEQIRKACLQLVPNHGSLDLWLTYENGIVNEFGFYEYQPQFGMNHIPLRDAMEFMRGAVGNLVTRYINGLR